MRTRGKMAEGNPRKNGWLYIWEYEQLHYTLKLEDTKDKHKWRKELKENEWTFWWIACVYFMHNVMYWLYNWPLQCIIGKTLLKEKISTEEILLNF